MAIQRRFASSHPGAFTVGAAIVENRPVAALAAECGGVLYGSWVR